MSFPVVFKLEFTCEGQEPDAVVILHDSRTDRREEHGDARRDGATLDIIRHCVR